MTAVLPDTIITTAGTVTSAAFDLRNGGRPPLNLSAALKFTYGSGGTSINVYVQTSFDGGSTWQDVISFTQITTANSKQFSNVGRTNKLAPVAQQDGALAAGSANDGFVGPLWRVKVVSVGTYAGSSTLHVDLFGGY